MKFKTRLIDAVNAADRITIDTFEAQRDISDPGLLAFTVPLVNKAAVLVFHSATLIEIEDGLAKLEDLEQHLSYIFSFEKIRGVEWQDLHPDAVLNP